MSLKKEFVDRLPEPLDPYTETLLNFWLVSLSSLGLGLILGSDASIPYEIAIRLLFMGIILFSAYVFFALVRDLREAKR